MKLNGLILVVGVLFLGLGAGQSRAEVDVGLTLDKDGLKSFHLAIGEHYQVPEKEVIVIREKKIADDDLPVVFFLAGRTGVAPEMIVKLRLGGKSWMEITAHFGLSAEIYYVPLAKPAGPPYGKAYGYYKNRKRSEWGKIKLEDADIVNFVNLRFLSDHYGYSPDDIISMRQKGANFVDINTKIKKEKSSKKKSEPVKVTEKPEKGDKGKGKNPK